jgi:hypothetical protein
VLLASSNASAQRQLGGPGKVPGKHDELYVDSKSNKLKSLHYGREEKMHLLKKTPGE